MRRLPKFSNKTRISLPDPRFAGLSRLLSWEARRRPASRLLYGLRLMTPIRLLVLSFAALTSPRADCGYVCL
jgi:hypothetical protein